MPEFPDVELYLHALESHFAQRQLKSIIVRSPFVVRSFETDINELAGRLIVRFSRIGKRIVWHFDDDYFLVVHLMIAGRFHLRKADALPNRKNELMAFKFDNATLMLTEAGNKKRASIHVVQGESGLEEFDRGGLDVLESSFEEFRGVLATNNRTLKRLLTDPTIFDGIGNAYSDEILHHAKLSPFSRTSKINEADAARLFESIRFVLLSWKDKLIRESGDKFPEKVTAFRPEMAVHGKFNSPCPDCKTKVQRVRYAENEMNYCPKCQTGGKVLADRSLSRLLKDDWPKTIDDLE